jgi:DNA invertase Pin-like site-specific DNA recombinase
MRAAIIHVRVSTSARAGEDRESLPEQARELHALAKSRGRPVKYPPDFRGREALPEGVFGDPGISGDTVEGRPGLVALLEAVRAGGIGEVLVRDVNRLARDELAAQQIHAVLEAHGVLLVTPAMEYDYANLQHRLMLGLLGSIEAYAKRWLVMNMKRAREAKKQRGEWGNSHVPYGFRWQWVDKIARTPGRPVPAPEEIEIVREIEAEQAELAAHKEQLTRLIEGEQLRQQAADRVAREMAVVADRLDSMSTSERRDLLRRLAFRVTVSPDGSRARVEFAGAPFLASKGLLPALSHSDAQSQLGLG